MKLLFEASASVSAPLAPVQALIDNGWAVRQFVRPEARPYVDVDHRDGVAGFQGHWWYRGEISASESAGRTLVTYRVFNIAKRGAWAVPLANRLFIGYRKGVQSGVERLAAAIEEHLAQR